MSEIFRTVSFVAVAVGVTWIIQAAGFTQVGLLSISPTFLFLGAIVTGAGAGAIIGLSSMRSSERVPAVSRA